LFFHFSLPEKEEKECFSTVLNVIISKIGRVGEKLDPSFAHGQYPRSAQLSASGKATPVPAEKTKNLKRRKQQ
jgi:hypothetical protein